MPAQEGPAPEGGLGQLAVGQSHGVEHGPALHLPAAGVEVDVGIGLGPVVLVAAVEEQIRLPQPAGHQILQHRGPLVAPGCDGVDNLRLRVLVDAADEVGAEPVGRVEPLCAQVVGHVHHGVKLVLGHLDAVGNEQVVHQVLRRDHGLTEQPLRLLLADAVGVVRRIAEGAVAYVPLPLVAVGHGLEALELLDERDALVAGGIGLHCQGRGRQQRQHQQQAQAHGYYLFDGGALFH